MLHWAGDLNAGHELREWFPVFDPKHGEDTQWTAWKASEAKKPWFKLFPTDQASFFLVSIIHEFAHEENHDDLMLTQLGILFTRGLSSAVSNMDFTRSPAALFHDYWVSDAPLKPPSCSGSMSRALTAGGGGSMGVNAGMMSHVASSIKMGARGAGGAAILWERQWGWQSERSRPKKRQTKSAKQQRKKQNKMNN